MLEWVFVAIAIATGGAAAEKGSFYEILSPLPATMGAIYASNNVDEVVSPIPGTVIDDDDDGDAQPAAK